MQVRSLVVQWIPVNVVNNLAGLGFGNFAVLPLPAVSTAPVSQAVRLQQCCVGSIASFCRCAFDWARLRHVSDRSDHPVAAAHMFAAGEGVDFLHVGIKRVAVTMPHLVVANAHFPSRNRSVAVFASPADCLASPCVIDGPVLFLPLVVHQAQSASGMPSSAAFYVADLIKFWGCHINSLPFICFPKLYTRYKALGNSMAVPVMRFIGQRIADVLNAQMEKVA